MPSPMIDLTAEYGRPLLVNPALIEVIEPQPNDFNDLAGSCVLYLCISGQRYQVGESVNAAAGAVSLTALEAKLWPP